jgi:hypothetical protein
MKKRYAICLLALAPAMAGANIIPTGTSVDGSGPFTWNYNLQLSQDQNVNPGLPPTDVLVPHEDLNIGSLLTLFDFAGYVDGSCDGPTGWTCTAQLLGFTPDDVLPTDRADLMNITWVYTTGAPILGQPSGVDLGNFSAQSLFNTEGVVSYAARGVKNIGASEGSIADNVGSTRGPVSNVPEPGSLGLAGLGLLLLVARLRKARTAAA